MLRLLVPGQSSDEPGLNPGGQKGPGLACGVPSEACFSLICEGCLEGTPLPLGCGANLPVRIGGHPNDLISRQGHRRCSPPPPSIRPRDPLPGAYFQPAVDGKDEISSNQPQLAPPTSHVDRALPSSTRARRAEPASSNAPPSCLPTSSPRARPYSDNNEHSPERFAGHRPISPFCLNLSLFLVPATRARQAPLSLGVNIYIYQTYRRDRSSITCWRYSLLSSPIPHR